MDLSLHDNPAIGLRSILNSTITSGAPGLGPMSVRGDPVVFKDGFRSRQYCIRECAELCVLQADVK